MCKKKYVEKIKFETMCKYGSVCVECGCSDLKKLTIDHIDGGGRNHRKETVGRGGYSFYLWLRRNNYPKGFRVLCFNCNCLKGHHGFLPHETKKESNNCVFCNDVLSNNQFYVHEISNHSICKYCSTLKAAKLEHVTKKQIRTKEVALNHKLNAIRAYGDCCCKCKEKDILLLTLDHIDGGGEKERKESRQMGVSFYRNLVKNNFPQGKLQVLCYNCNCSKPNNKE